MTLFPAAIGAGILLGVAAKLYIDQHQVTSSTDNLDKYFSKDYYEAREKFRGAVRLHPMNLELHTLNINVQEPDEREKEDLTIDIAILRRSQSKLLIHVSGTHGVEGFAGSAIQNALLNSSSLMHQNEASPTVVIVHALNPYGFQKLRRFNENNVDLNRNFLSPLEFEEVLSRDPNHSGYVNMVHLINPPESLESKFDFFYLKAIYYIAKHGFTTLKSSVVSGTYHHPKGLFFGGQELQQSHILLKEFLRTQFDIEKMDEVGILDVHTGLGASGFDSIVINNGTNADIGRQCFSGKELEYANHLTTFEKSNKAMSGYDKVIGLVPVGLAKQVFSSPTTKSYSITQEFGTVPSVIVFKAMRAENAMYQYDRSNRSRHAKDLRDVFYLEDDTKWKSQVIDRGQMVFNQLWEHLSSPS